MAGDETGETVQNNNVLFWKNQENIIEPFQGVLDKMPGFEPGNQKGGFLLFQSNKNALPGWIQREIRPLAGFEKVRLF